MARAGLSKLMKLIEQEAVDSPVEVSFLTDLKHSIEVTNSKEYRKGSASYKPSSMSCIRQMYYIRTGVDPVENFNYQLIGICNNGTDTHIRIQTYISKMKDNGIDCEYVDVAQYVRDNNLEHLEIVSQNGMETKLYHKDLHISFLCDGIIKYKGSYYILELKTEGSNKFWSRTEVDPSHYNQACCYSLSLNLDSVLFVYINRDTYDMKSYLYTPGNDLKHAITAMILTCEDYVENGEIPEIKFRDSKPCKYCGFKDQCRKDG